MPQPSFQHLGIIGAGAWGTALAASLVSAGRQTTFWAHAPEVMHAVNETNENNIHLPGIKLDKRLRATTRLADLAQCDGWILAVPAQRVRATCQALTEVAGDNTNVVIVAAKGIEQQTSALMSEIVAAELPRHPLAILSGPSFASEVARGLPAALTLATKYKALGEGLAAALAAPALRVYRSDDVIGAQIGGAVKNVLAVACGIVAGRSMGENARAAIITRGLAEIMRLGIALGARAETLMGLSGLGDLVLTCSSAQSRNTSVGIALGQGKTLADILKGRASVAEGVTTAAAARALAEKHHIDMPIVAAVDAILNRNADIDGAVAELLARPLKP
ncbi:MAG: NAD(P)-dependent glycerol-3-phosphate dehydrogenase, partial [Pseudomonadota bacterium]|nr:NAD(P)-dependent glycerol-3-phosphate dehydrogenase [Pseudomonadota bacterium]